MYRRDSDRLGNTRDELTSADLPTLALNIRRLLAPVAPPAAIDAVLSDLERGLA